MKCDVKKISKSRATDWQVCFVALNSQKNLEVIQIRTISFNSPEYIRHIKK